MDIVNSELESAPKSESINANNQSKSKTRYNDKTGGENLTESTSLKLDMLIQNEDNNPYTSEDYPNIGINMSHKFKMEI